MYYTGISSACGKLDCKTGIAPPEIGYFKKIHRLPSHLGRNEPEKFPSDKQIERQWGSNLSSNSVAMVHGFIGRAFMEILGTFT
jgi:hypothetical protein